MTPEVRKNPREFTKKILAKSTVCIKTSYVFPFVGEDYHSIIERSHAFLPPPVESIQKRVNDFPGATLIALLACICAGRIMSRQWSGARIAPIFEKQRI